MPKLTKHFFLVLISFCFAFTSYASGDYQVEIIVFKNLELTQSESSSNSGTVTYESTPKTRKKTPSFAKTWSLRTSLLNTAARNMKGVPSQYKIITHTSWGQASAPFKKSAAVDFKNLGLDGYIKVFASDLLFAELDLTFENNSLSERRRLKLNEVHYFDSAGFGVLLQVSRWESPKTRTKE